WSLFFVASFLPTIGLARWTYIGEVEYTVIGFLLCVLLIAVIIVLLCSRRYPVTLVGEEGRQGEGLGSRGRLRVPLPGLLLLVVCAGLGAGMFLKITDIAGLWLKESMASLPYLLQGWTYLWEGWALLFWVLLLSSGVIALGRFVRGGMERSRDRVIFN